MREKEEKKRIRNYHIFHPIGGGPFARIPLYIKVSTNIALDEQTILEEGRFKF